MYLKLPTYINYQNVAICPNGKLETFCSILDKKETINLQWEGNFTYVPFEAGHSYIMFCGNEFTEQVTYFQTDKAMFNFLKKIIGTNIGKFYVHEYEITKTWIPHRTPLVNHDKELKDNKVFSDVTLVSDDEVEFFAHKLVLSSSSTFFKNILLKYINPHPMLYLGGVTSSTVAKIIDFVYHGEVEVQEIEINSFLKVAAKFKLQGLEDFDDNDRIEVLEEIKNKGNDETENNYRGLEDIDDNERIESVDEIKNNDETETDYKKKINLSSSIVQNFEKITSIKQEEIPGDTKISDIEEAINKLMAKFDGGYVCGVCKKVEKHKGHLMAHIERHHVKGLVFTCSICEEKFDNRIKRKYHLKKCH